MARAASKWEETHQLCHFSCPRAGRTARAGTSSHWGTRAFSHSSWLGMASPPNNGTAFQNCKWTSGEKNKFSHFPAFGSQLLTKAKREFSVS